MQQITWGQVLFISLAETTRHWDFNCILMIRKGREKKGEGKGGKRRQTGEMRAITNKHEGT